MAQILLNETTPNGGDLDANLTELYSKTAWSTTGIGYATGAGGTVTQTSSKSSNVTLNKMCGQIVMNSASLASGATVAFGFLNSSIAATDVVVVSIGSGVASSASYRVQVGSTGAAQCGISLTNISGGALAEAVVINFLVIKSVTS